MVQRLNCSRRASSSRWKSVFKVRYLVPVFARSKRFCGNGFVRKSLFNSSVDNFVCVTSSCLTCLQYIGSVYQYTSLLQTVLRRSRIDIHFSVTYMTYYRDIVCTYNTSSTSSSQLTFLGISESAIYPAFVALNATSRWNIVLTYMWHSYNILLSCPGFVVSGPVRFPSVHQYIPATGHLVQVSMWSNSILCRASSVAPVLPLS